MSPLIGSRAITPAGDGLVDSTVTHPDGLVIVRVNDHWFPAVICLIS